MGGETSSPFHAIIACDCAISSIFVPERSGMVPRIRSGACGLTGCCLPSCSACHQTTLQHRPLINARSLTRAPSVHVGLSPQCNYLFFLAVHFTEHGGRLLCCSDVLGGSCPRNLRTANACRRQEQKGWRISGREATRAIHAVWKAPLKKP